MHSSALTWTNCNQISIYCWFIWTHCMTSCLHVEEDGCSCLCVPQRPVCFISLSYNFLKISVGIIEPVQDGSKIQPLWKDWNKPVVRNLSEIPPLKDAVIYNAENRWTVQWHHAHVYPQHQLSESVFQGLRAQPDHSGSKPWRRINTVTAQLQNPDCLLIRGSAGAAVCPPRALNCALKFRCSEELDGWLVGRPADG